MTTATPSLTTARKTTVSAPPFGRRDALALLIVLAVTCVVQWQFADAVLTYDELWHLSLANGTSSPLGWFRADVLYASPARVTALAAARPLREVWTHMDGVLHPPLYVVVLRGWRTLFGEGDRTAQALSIAWSLVGVAGVFASARLTMGRGLAIVCGLALGLAQTQAYFAQEVRGYAMLVGLASIGCWMMTRIDARGATRGRAVALGLWPLPLLLTHYFAAGAALAIAAYGFTRLRKHRAAFGTALAFGAAAYAACWLPFAVRQLDAIGTGDAFVRVSARDPARELALLASAPFRLLVDRGYAEQPTGLVGGLLFVLPWLLVRRAPWLLPWALWLCSSLLALFALDVARSTEHLLLVRYCAAASPAVVLLLVGCARAIDRRAAYAMGYGAVLMGSIYLFTRSAVTGDSRSFAATAHAISARAAPGEAILAYPGRAPAFYGDMLLMTCAHEPGLFPRPVLNMTRPLSPECVARLPTRAWLMAGPLDVPFDVLLGGARVLGEPIVTDVGITLYHVEWGVAGAPAVPAG